MKDSQTQTELEKVRPDEPAAPEAKELPAWKQELSERLKAVREKREANKKAAAPSIAPVVPAETQLQPLRPRKIMASQLKAVAPNPRTPVPQQKKLEPLPPKSPVKDPQEVANLIDKAVSRQPIRAEEIEAPPIALFMPRNAFNEDKLILLSRTLSGLIDLITVALFTAAFIIAADYVSGIFAVDYISWAVYGGLFLLIFFGYSIFFMASSTQTIGMMITDLRVVGIDGKRPLVRQIILRYAAFLISFFGLGIGLAWSLFNSKSLCFHDYLSRTHVIRV
jgi:uncharacterized RDD family membrane protein YckC